MSNIENIKSPSDLLAYIRGEARLNGNLSIRGVAKLAGVDDMSVIRNGEFASQKLAEKLTQYGFKAAELTEQGFTQQAVILTLVCF